MDEVDNMQGQICSISRKIETTKKKNQKEML